MTREEIEKFSDEEPYCFETDREERWYEIGCIDGLRAADAEPNLKILWHDASEEPNRDITSKLIYYIEDTDNISIRTLGKLLEFYGEPDLSWNSVVKNLSITKWAYINDLLPTE